MSRLSLYFLGPPRIELDDVPIKVDTRKAIALVAYLAVMGESQSRDSLVNLLWPDYDQTRARTVLRRTLYALNKALPGHWLASDKETIGLNPNAQVWVDVGHFHKYLSECQKHGHTKAEACPECIKPLSEAVGLYRGDFMAGFSLQDSVNFDDWQFLQTQNLRSEVTGALGRLVSWHKGQGKLEAAIGRARRWLEIDRASEAAHRHLMELYAKTGQRAAALRQYEECVKVLEKELGEVPDEETVKLYEAIKGNRVTVELPSRKPEKVHNNLPRQLTSFIGREKEIGEVKRLLSTTCLLTLTGSGGCGKTRLALQVASGLVEEYKDGVWLVDLAPLSDPALVPQEVVRAIDVSEQPGRPLLDTLSDYLKSRQLLLVLDNCEHLIEACATLSESLLQACPNLKILATSREALGITGELTYRVPSLSLPDPQVFLRSTEASDLTQYEAVRLFIERALFSQPTFTATDRNTSTVAKICHRLDGIPLAIELAAARVKGLSVEGINERLDDRFRLLTGGSRTALPRHQTLLATMDWSYSLLSEAERVLLNRLSVFAGGFTLESVEAVCVGEGIGASEIFDLMMGLVNKSLVVVDERDGEVRYRLLETVRQYGREKLIEAGEEPSLRGRHLEWFLALAERAEPELYGPDQVAWMDHLEAEHDNIRAALRWSLESGKGEMGLRLAGMIWWFWVIRRYEKEGREWLDRVLTESLVPSGLSPSELALSETKGRSLERNEGRDVSTPARARALIAAGYLAHAHDHRQSEELLEKGLALSRELGYNKGISRSLGFLGIVAHSLGDYGRAKGLFEEELAMSREIDDKYGIAFSILKLGVVVWLQGDHERATAMLEENLSLSRRVGDRSIIELSLLFLGLAALQEGHYERAKRLFEEGLALGREAKNKGAIVWSLRNLGLAAQYQKDYKEAEALYKESLIWGQELGTEWDVALLLKRLAVVACAQGQMERAARLSGAAEVLYQPIGFPPFPIELDNYDSSMAAVRAALGEEAFSKAWEEGRKMTIEEAIGYALE